MKYKPLALKFMKKNRPQWNVVGTPNYQTNILDAFWKQKKLTNLYRVTIRIKYNFIESAISKYQLLKGLPLEQSAFLALA